jgi:hypothetical protein
MKKLILTLAIALAASLPMATYANHLDGAWGGWGDNHIKFNAGSQQHQFSHGGNVPFVDEHGASVDYHTLKPGHPITVDYSGERGHETVNRVIVHQQQGQHQQQQQTDEHHGNH